MLQIFRKGKQTASDGTVIDFTSADLEGIASSYSADKHEAPIVVGHPATDAPAYGWIKSLKVEGDHLEAEPHQVDPQFAELVDQGRFKKISASFWPPEHPRNPVPGKYYLRHVGFLGAQPPAVKGLRTPQFDDAQGVLEFGDWSWGLGAAAQLFGRVRDFFIEKFGLDTADKVVPDYQVEAIRQAAQRSEESSFSPMYSDNGATMTPEQIKQLEADKARLERELAESKAAADKKAAEFAEAEAKRKADDEKRATEERNRAQAEHVSFADGLVKDGKLLPAHKAGVVAMLGLAAGAPAVEFEEAGVKKSQPQLDFLKSFLKGLPNTVTYAEIAKGKVPQGASAIDIAAKAKEYQDEQAKLGHVITIAEAVQHVSGPIVSA